MIEMIESVCFFLLCVICKIDCSIAFDKIQRYREWEKCVVVCLFRFRCGSIFASLDKPIDILSEYFGFIWRTSFHTPNKYFFGRFIPFFFFSSLSHCCSATTLSPVYFFFVVKCRSHKPVEYGLSDKSYIYDIYNIYATCVCMYVPLLCAKKR